MQDPLNQFPKEKNKNKRNIPSFPLICIDTHLPFSTISSSPKRKKKKTGKKTHTSHGEANHL